MSLGKLFSLSIITLALVGCASTPKDETPSKAFQIANEAQIEGVRDVSYKKVQRSTGQSQVASKTRLLDGTLDYYAIGWAGGVSGLIGPAVSGRYGQFVAWVPESEAANGDDAVAKVKALLEKSPYWPELENSRKEKWGWQAQPRRMPYGDNRLNTLFNPVKSFVFTAPPLVDAPEFMTGKAYGPIYFLVPNVIDWNKKKTNVENFIKISSALPSWVYIYQPALETDKQVPAIFNQGSIMMFVTQPKL